MFREKAKVFSLVLLIILAVSTGVVFAKDYPRPKGLVNDFAGIFSAGFVNDLEADLQAFRDKTGAEIAVLAINSLEADPIENYAVELFKAWGIGQKGKDNGVLLLISKEDRKIKIEVGYGLEAIINDAKAGEIIRKAISPAFKEGEYEKGILRGTGEIKGLISSPTSSPEKQERKTDFGGWFDLILLGFFFVLPLLSYLASFYARTKEIRAGGITGGIIGILIGVFVGAIVMVIFLGLAFGLLGLFLDWLLSKNYEERKTKGLRTDWFHSFGGFSGGGGGSGFSFGGGSSGGGGASGSW